MTLCTDLATWVAHDDAQTEMNSEDRSWSMHNALQRFEQVRESIRNDAELDSIQTEITNRGLSSLGNVILHTVPEKSKSMMSLLKLVE